MLDLKTLASQTTFSRAQVVELLRLTSPRRVTVTLIAHDADCLSRVYLQRNAKSPGWLFPGGGQDGEESHGNAGLREVTVEEHPVLQHHIKPEELQLFTVCTVIRSGPSGPAQFEKPLPTFCSGLGIPDEVMELFAEVQVPLRIGTDIVMFCPVHGEVDLEQGRSAESLEMGCFDLAETPIEFGFYYTELARDWLEFVRSGFSKRPDPRRVYRRS